jgi:alternate signal-mediated exported protein
MNKSLKGALAAVAAAALLLGGAGSLAYWSGEEDVPGGSFTSGYLRINDVDCATAGWTLDGGAAYTNQRLVPGDELTKSCSFTLDGVGDHMTVSLDTATPGWSSTNALTDDLTVDAAFEGAGGPLPDPAVIDQDETVTATIVVTFDSASGNETNIPAAGLAAVLDDVTITATQGHSAA